MLLNDCVDLWQVLEKALGPGSELWVFSEVPEEERGKRLLDKGVNSAHFKNVKLVHRTGNANKKKHLETLPLETFDSVCAHSLVIQPSLEHFNLHPQRWNLPFQSPWIPTVVRI